MPFSMKTISLATVALAATAVLASPIEVATPVELAERASTTHYLFSFGDSYSQTGFNVTTGPLPNCSNPMGNPPFPGYTTDGGVNWIGEIVQTAPSCFLEWNFAYGGATVNASLVTPYEPTVLSFIDQVAEFSSSVGKKPKGYKWTASNAAAAVWLGVNDVGNSFYEANATAILQADIASYFGQLSVLYNAGLRKFLLLSVPPTDRTPMFIAQGTATTKSVKADIAAWNAQFNASALQWAVDHKESNVMVLDTQPIFTYILNHPKQYGAPNATCFDADGTSCLWWNNYHPGQAIQKAVGAAAYEKLFGAGSLELIAEPSDS